MKALVERVVSRSRFDVSHVKIAGASEDSCLLTLEGRITGTGPIGCLIGDTQVGLFFNNVCMVKLRLPAVRMSAWGARIAVSDQRLRILDMAAFKACLGGIVRHDAVILCAASVQPTVMLLGVDVPCDYSVDLVVPGMGGPRASVVRLARDGQDATMVVRFENPSPVEMDHGVTVFELRNDAGAVMARMETHLRIACGVSECTLRGTFCDSPGAALSSRARLVGVGAQGSSWCRETAPLWNLELDMGDTLAEVMGQ